MKIHKIAVLIFCFTILFNTDYVSADWVPGSTTIQNNIADNDSRTFFLSMDHPLEFEVLDQIIFSMNTFGGWDVGYDYHFNWDFSEGIDVASDGWSYPKLMTRADLDIGFRVWLKLIGPGVTFDFYKIDPFNIDILEVLGVNSKIEEEISIPDIQFSLPFLEDNNPLVECPFKSGIYDGDYSKTTFFNLAKIAQIPAGITGNLGVVRGLQGNIAFGLKSIDYYSGNSGIGSQTSAYSGADVSDHAGSEVTVSKRDYIFEVVPSIGAGVAIYAEINVLGYNIAEYYYPMKGNPKPHLINAEISKSVEMPSISFEKTVNYFVPSAEGAPIVNNYEPNDIANKANWIYNKESQSHNISPVDDVDWIKFSITSASNVVIETSGPSGDTIIGIYESDATTLVEDNDDDGRGTFSKINRILQPGTYYIKIEEYGNDNLIPTYYVSFASTEISTPIIAAPGKIIVSVKTDGFGSSIEEDTWQKDDDPYFYWNKPSMSGSIVGYSYAIDSFPPNEVLLTNEFLQVPANSLSNGRHYFNIKAKDNNGIWTSTTSFIIKVDCAPPVPIPGVQVNRGNSETTSNTVVLSNLYANDDLSGVSKVSFMNQGGSWSPWKNYLNNNTEWDLTAYIDTSDYGLKTIYVRYSDLAGNISESISVSIEYVPLIPVITVKDNMGVAITEWNFEDVTLKHSWMNPSYVEKNFIIYNDGWDTLEVYEVSINSSVFSVSPSNSSESSDNWSIPKNTSKAFKVFFKPTAIGISEGVLYVKSNTPQTPSLQIPLAGKGVGAAIRMDQQKNWDFGTVGVGSSSSNSYTIFNDGDIDLEVLQARFWGDKVNFSVEPKNTGESTFDNWIIPPGDSKNFTLHFSPIMSGVYNSWFELLTNDPDWNDAGFQITLTGKSEGGIKPVLLKTIDTTHLARSIVVKNSFAFIVGNFGLQIADVRNPENTQVLSNYSTISTATRIYIEDSTAYIAEVDGTVEIVDISDITNPTYVSHIKVAENARGIVFLDSGASEIFQPRRLFVACGSDGIKVIDVTNLSTPSVIGSINPTNQFIWDLTLIGNGANGWSENRVAVTIGNAVYVGGIYNPGVFTADSWRYFSNPKNLHVDGHKLYVTDDYGLHIIDVSNFDSPILLSKIPKNPRADDYFTVSARGGLAYMNQPSVGVMIINVESPDQPEVLGYYEKRTLGICGTESLLYVTGDYVTGDNSWSIVDPQVFSDIEISAKTDESYAVKPGGTFTTTINISNLGTSNIPVNSNFRVKAYLSHDHSLSGDDIEISPSLIVNDSIRRFSQLEKIWELSIDSNISEGQYYLIYELVVPDTSSDNNIANNIWSYPSAVLSVDNTPPTILSLDLDPDSDSGVQGDNITKHTIVTLQGESEDGVTVSLKKSGVIINSSNVETNGNFYFLNVPLTNDINEYIVEVNDMAGNKSEINYQVKLDQNVSSLSFDLISSSDSGIKGDYLTKFYSISVAGETELESTVYLFVGEDEVSTTTTTKFSNAFAFSNIPIYEGVNDVIVKVTDKAGNIRFIDHLITRDTKIALPQLLSIEIDQFFFDITAPEDGILRLFVDNELISYQDINEGEGIYRLVSDPLTPGEHTLYSNLEDLAGNISSNSEENSIWVPFTEDLIEVYRGDQLLTEGSTMDLGVFSSGIITNGIQFLIHNRGLQELILKGVTATDGFTNTTFLETSVPYGSSTTFSVRPETLNNDLLTGQIVIKYINNKEQQSLFSFTVKAEIKSDVDLDKLPDWWELQIINADPNDGIVSVEDVLPGDDFDKNGFSNLNEYMAGTDPTDENSKPIIKGDINADGGVDLTDAIIASKISVGGSRSDVYPDRNVNGNCKIGSVEAIYVFQVLSGMRKDRP